MDLTLSFLILPNHSKVVQGHLAAAWAVAPHLN